MTRQELTKKINLLVNAYPTADDVMITAQIDHLIDEYAESIIDLIPDRRPYGAIKTQVRRRAGIGGES